MAEVTERCSLKKEEQLILIVDDDPIVRKLLSIIVETAGYGFETAVNGNDALTIVSEKEINLILLDVMMPGGINGFEVCQTIKQTPTKSHIPIILVTALGDAENRQKGRSVGAIELIAKPFSNEQLLSTIQNCLETVSSQRKIIQE